MVAGPSGICFESFPETGIGERGVKGGKGERGKSKRLERWKGKRGNGGGGREGLHPHVPGNTNESQDKVSAGEGDRLPIVGKHDPLCPKKAREYLLSVCGKNCMQKQKQIISKCNCLNNIVSCDSLLDDACNVLCNSVFILL
jgi:hypothetical protein